MQVVYGCAWDEIFFKIMLASMLLDEFEKIVEFMDFNNELGSPVGQRTEQSAQLSCALLPS